MRQETVEINRKVRTLKAKCRIGWDWIGLDKMGWDGYTTTAVTPRASLQSDANKYVEMALALF